LMYKITLAGKKTSISELFIYFFKYNKLIIMSLFSFYVITNAYTYLGYTPAIFAVITLFCIYYFKVIEMFAPVKSDLDERVEVEINSSQAYKVPCDPPPENDIISDDNTGDKMPTFRDRMRMSTTNKNEILATPPKPVLPKPGPGTPAPKTETPAAKPGPETPAVPKPGTPATPKPGTPGPGTPAAPGPETPATPKPGPGTPAVPKTETPAPGPGPGAPAQKTEIPAAPGPETPAAKPGPGTPDVPKTETPAAPGPGAPVAKPPNQSGGKKLKLIEIDSNNIVRELKKFNKKYAKFLL